MGSVIARTIGEKKPDEAFFYHNQRNHFWKILQVLFSGVVVKEKLSVAEKMEFLNRHSIALANLVHEIKVDPKYVNDPGDKILFEALREGRLKLKIESDYFKKILNETPLFFTCKASNGRIRDLIKAYFHKNDFKDSIADNNICYLPSPTRCNHLKRSIEWKLLIVGHFNIMKIELPFNNG